MSIRDLLDAIEAGKTNDAQEAFQSIMSDKVSQLLDTQRVEIAKTMFNTTSVEESVDSLDETAYESNIKDHDPVVAHGVKGMKSKPFKKKFKSMIEFNKWHDSESSDDHTVHKVEKHF